MDVKFLDIYTAILPEGNITDDEIAELQSIHFTTCVTYITTSCILLLVGVPGNIITIVVLNQRDMKDAVFSTYIVSLSIFNVLTLVWCVPRFIVNALLERDIVFKNFYFCVFYRAVSLSLTCIANWHLVLISGARLCFLIDKDRRLIHLYESPIKMIFILMTVILAIQIPVVMMWVTDTNIRGEKIECFLPTSSLFVFFQIFFVTISSALLLLMINFWLFYLHHDKQSGLLETSHTHRLRKRLLVLVFISSVQYLVCCLPICIVPQNFHRIFDLNTVVGRHKRDFGFNICLLLLYSNNSTNFLVYCFFGRKFRQQFCKLLRHCSYRCHCAKHPQEPNFDCSTDYPMTISTQDVSQVERRSSELEAMYQYLASQSRHSSKPEGHEEEVVKPENKASIDTDDGKLMAIFDDFTTFV